MPQTLCGRRWLVEEQRNLASFALQKTPVCAALAIWIKEQKEWVTPCNTSCYQTPMLWRHIFNVRPSLFDDVNAWSSWYAAPTLVRRCMCSWLGFTEGTRWNSSPPCPPASPCPMSHAVLLILQCGSNLLLHILVWPWMLRVFTKRWRKQWPFSAVTQVGCLPEGLLSRPHVVRKMGGGEAIQTNGILNAERPRLMAAWRFMPLGSTHSCLISAWMSGRHQMH